MDWPNVGASAHLLLFLFFGHPDNEVGIVVSPLIMQGIYPNVYFYYLISPTAIAAVLFLAEGMWLSKKTRAENGRKKCK
jgi:hypothetical protein